MPVRADAGPDKGRLQWRRPSAATLRNMLVHPMYAGAYVYGRSFQARGRPRRGRPQRLPRDQWQVLLRDRYPAYIAWEAYESNVARLAANRSLREARGAPRRGRALLAGLVVCGRCGARMMTRYAGKASRPRYYCEADRVNYGAARCQGLAARALDDEVVRLALQALTPSALEVSLRVAADLQGQFEQAEGQWRRRLERARFEAERARRQYDAVEPENRLVARTLEAAWEQRLAALRELSEEHERFLRQQPRAAERRRAGARSAAWRPTCRPSGRRRARPTPTARRSSARSSRRWSSPSRARRSGARRSVRWAGGGETRPGCGGRWPASSSWPTGSDSAGGWWISRGRGWRRRGSPSGSAPRGCVRPAAGRSRRRSWGDW